MRVTAGCMVPWVVLALAAGAWPPQSAPAAAQRVTVRDGWVRESLPGRSVTSAYLTLENRGPGAVRLVGGQTVAARVVELHEMRTDGDTMRMRRLDGVDVPSGGKVSLTPGGLHLMLIGLTHPVRRGEHLALVLRFADGSELNVELTVRPLEHVPG
jgi:periplasmic copper chaperone A